MSVPGREGADEGKPDGSGVHSGSGEISGGTESSGDTEGSGAAVVPMSGREDKEESVIPALFNTAPEQSASTSRNAQTSSNVISRKRERICFIQSPRQHCKMGIFSQIGVILSGYSAEESDQEHLSAKIREGISHERKPEAGH